MNFDQIRVGDQLKASVTQTSVIRMAKPGEKVVIRTTETIATKIEKP